MFDLIDYCSLEGDYKGTKVTWVIGKMKMTQPLFLIFKVGF